MNAYNKIYLENAMHNIAVMLDYGSLADGDPYPKTACRTIWC